MSFLRNLIARVAQFNRNLVKTVVIAVLVVFAVYLITKWTVMRVYVPPGEALLVIHKFGKELPPGHMVVPKEWEGYKGVQEEVLGPGRYFINPVTYDTQPVKL